MYSRVFLLTMIVSFFCGEKLLHSSHFLNPLFKKKEEYLHLSGAVRKGVAPGNGGCGEKGQADRLSLCNLQSSQIGQFLPPGRSALLSMTGVPAHMIPIEVTM